MRLFRRHPPIQPREKPAKAKELWVWRHDYAVTRILLDGNELQVGWRDTDEDREPFRAFRGEIARIARIERGRVHNCVRCYSNYIAIQYHDLKTRMSDDQLEQIIGQVCARVGWSEAPNRDEILSSNAFLDLNQEHDFRWKLGSYK